MLIRYLQPAVTSSKRIKTKVTRRSSPERSPSELVIRRRKLWLLLAGGDGRQLDWDPGKGSQSSECKPRTQQREGERDRQSATVQLWWNNPPHRWLGKASDGTTAALWLQVERWEWVAVNRLWEPMAGLTPYLTLWQSSVTRRHNPHTPFHHTHRCNTSWKGFTRSQHCVSHEEQWWFG